MIILNTWEKFHIAHKASFPSGFFLNLLVIYFFRYIYVLLLLFAQKIIIFAFQAVWLPVLKIHISYFVPIFSILFNALL